MSYVFTGLEVDGLLFGVGINLRTPVKVATTTAGTLATSFAAGQTVDGVILATGNRILIKNQATATENGVYVVQSSGAPVRDEDAIVGDNFNLYNTWVQTGTVNQASAWVCNNTPGADIVGTNNLTFVSAGGSGTVTLSGSAVNNQFVRFSGTSGAIQGSTWVTDNSGNVTGAGSLGFADSGFPSNILTLVPGAQATASANATIPDLGGVNRNFVFDTLAQTLTNKSLSTPSVTGNIVFPGANNLSIVATTPTVGAASATIPDLLGVSRNFVFDTLTQTLTNKALTTPTVTGGTFSFNNGTGLTISDATPTVSQATATIPDLAGVSQQFVMGAVAQTLTNKTLTSPTLNTSLVFKEATNNLTQTAADQTAGGSTANVPNLGGTVQDFVFTTLAQTISNKTLGNALNANNFQINNVATPTSNGDAANKSYVDSVAAGLDTKTSCHVATTANLSGTYTVNAPGSADTLNGISGIVIDGVTLVVGNRVLVKNQTDPKQNGIYSVTSLPSGTSTNLTRATDMTGISPNMIAAGDYTFVEAGTVNISTGWVLTGAGTLVVNTDALNWTLFAVSGTVVAGTALTKASNTLSVNTTGVSTGIVSNNVAVISSATANQVHVSTGTAGAEAVWGTVALNSANAVSGTLPVGNGGTGATTFTSGNLLLGNGTSPVSASTLVASTVTTASNTQTLTNKSLIDTSTLILNNADNTKIFRFDASGITTATTRVLTIPDATTTLVGIDTTQTLSNKTLTAPKIVNGGFIADANGNADLTFVTTASAVNNLQIANAVSGADPVISAIGSSANIGIDFQTKGTGQYVHLGTATQQAQLVLREQTSNGTTGITLQTPAALAGSYSLTLPPNTGTAGYVLSTDGTGVSTWIKPPSGRVSYKWVNSQVNVTNTTAQTIAYHAWSNSAYTDLGNTVTVIYYVTGLTNRSLTVSVFDGTSTIGTLTTSSGGANGIYSFTCTRPSSDVRLELRVLKGASGGTSPSIFGVQFEFTA